MSFSFRFRIKDFRVLPEFLIPSPLQVNSSLPFTILIPGLFFFTYGAANEKRRLLLGALVQNLKKKKLEPETLYSIVANITS